MENAKIEKFKCDILSNFQNILSTKNSFRKGYMYQVKQCKDKHNEIFILFVIHVTKSYNTKLD